VKHYEGELCEECGINPKAFKGYSVIGTRLYRAVCTTCHKGRYHRPWLKFRGTECEECTYKPIFIGTLQVHHRDGDKKNNEPENLTTLCANCHSELGGLIFDLDGDWEKAESLLTKFIRALLG